MPLSEQTSVPSTFILKFQNKSVEFNKVFNSNQDAQIVMLSIHELLADLNHKGIINIDDFDSGIKEVHDELAFTTTSLDSVTAKLDGSFRLWYMHSYCGDAIYHRIVDNPYHAKIILDAYYDLMLFLLENGHIDDYVNAGGLEVMEDNEWSEWISDIGMDIGEITALDEPLEDDNLWQRHAKAFIRGLDSLSDNKPLKSS